MKPKEFYNVAIYLRLSRDDEDIDGNKTESNSISSQRDMIRSYVRQHKDMEIYDVYLDDGWSGANFNRPAFKRMMADIEAGKIDCVIVKDLSRLGRDYIEAGRLIQKTFPAFCVRFIALTDNFDSLTADYNETSLVLPVKNFVNDSYCRDISQKVRSHLKMKWENGEFIGAFTVYGYKRSKAQRNRLVIDEYPAGIVRKIFAWKIEGMSSLAIAGRLDRMGALSPMEYKKSMGEKYNTGFAAGYRARWSAVAVKRILVNEVYTGTLVQGKDEKINYKVNKSIRKPEGEWTRVENTHEAIIAREDFETVKKLLAIDCRAYSQSSKSHIFAGLLFCGDCEQPMVRRLNRYKGTEQVKFICGTKNSGSGCTRHSIGQKELSQVVLAGLKQQISLFLDKSYVLEHICLMEVQFDDIAVFDKEIEKLRKEQDKYITLRAGLYEDWKGGVITQEDYRNFRDIYECQYADLNEAVRKQEAAVKELFKAGITAGVQLERMKEVMQVTELDRNTLITFVNRIRIYEDKRILIELKFHELFTKVVMLAGTRQQKPSDTGGGAE